MPQEDDLFFRISASQRDEIRRRMTELKNLKMLAAGQAVAYRRLRKWCGLGWILVLVFAGFAFNGDIRRSKLDAEIIDLRAHIFTLDNLDRELDNITFTQYRSHPQRFKSHIHNACSRRILRSLYSNLDTELISGMNQISLDDSLREIPIGGWCDSFAALFLENTRQQSKNRGTRDGL